MHSSNFEHLLSMLKGTSFKGKNCFTLGSNSFLSEKSSHLKGAQMMRITVRFRSLPLISVLAIGSINLVEWTSIQLEASAGTSTTFVFCFSLKYSRLFCIISSAV